MFPSRPPMTGAGHGTAAPGGDNLSNYCRGGVAGGVVVLVFGRLLGGAVVPAGGVVVPLLALRPFPLRS